MKNISANQKRTQTASGVTLSGFTVKNLSGKPHHKLKSAIPLFLIVLCAVFGSVLTFTSMFYVSYSVPIVYTVITACSLIFTLSFLYPKSAAVICPLALIAEGVTVAVMWNDILRGYRFLSTSYIQGVNAAMYWNLPAQEYVWHPSYNYYTTLFICLCTVIICMLACLFIVFKPSAIGTFLVTFPFFECGAAFGCVPGYIPFMMMLASILAMLAVTLSGVKGRKPKDGSDFVTRRKKHTLARRTQPMAGTGLAVAALTLTVALLSSQFVALSFSRSVEINTLRIGIKEGLNNFVSQGFSGSGIGLADGELASLGSRVVEGKQHLTITMPKVSTAHYLRGFTGSKYTGTEWRDLDSYDNYRQMWSNFDAAGLHPQDFRAALLSALAQNDRKTGSTYKDVKVSSPLLDKPYSYIFNGSNLNQQTHFSYIRDTGVAADTRYDYTFGMFLGNTGLNRIHLSPLWKDPNFKSLWKEYTDFVYAEYTSVPDSMTSFKPIYTTREPKTDIYAYGEWVRKELSKDCFYTTETEKMPRGSDFVENFMFSTKEGYCVHFASAATMLFRAAGIPARYVEGYLISPSKFTADAFDKKTQTYTISATDADAHAWVEIFDEHRGWVQFEATPGFYNVTNSSAGEAEDETFDPNPGDTDGPGEFEVAPDNKDKLHPDSGDTNVTYITIFDTLRVWSICAIIFSILFILGGLLALRRRHAISVRHRTLKTKNLKKRVREAYDYFSKILFFELIQNEENRPYLKYAAFAAERSKYLDPDETRKAMDIFLKARFSDAPITAEEARYIVRFTNAYAKAVYTDATPVNRWIFGTVRNLY